MFAALTGTLLTLPSGAGAAVEHFVFDRLSRLHRLGYRLIDFWRRRLAARRWRKRFLRQIADRRSRDLGTARLAGSRGATGPAGDLRRDFVGTGLIGELSAFFGQDLHPHLGGAGSLEVQELSAPLGDIQDPPMGERSPVVNLKGDLAPVDEVRHPDKAGQRQCPMRRGQTVLVVGLAAGRLLPVKAGTVPGGNAGLVILVVDMRVVPDTGDLIGLADLIARGRSPNLATCRRSRQARRQRGRQTPVSVWGKRVMSSIQIPESAAYSSHVPNVINGLGRSLR